MTESFRRATRARARGETALPPAILIAEYSRLVNLGVACITTFVHFLRKIKTGVSCGQRISWISSRQFRLFSPARAAATPLASARRPQARRRKSPDRMSGVEVEQDEAEIEMWKIRKVRPSSSYPVKKQS